MDERELPAGTPLGAAMTMLAAAGPNCPAAIHEGVTVTRRELEERANRLAREYERLGVGQDSFVTVGLPNGTDFIAACLACWKLGATPQPVSHRIPRPELEQIVELADPALVVGLEAPGRRWLPAAHAPDPALPAGPIEPVRAAAAYKAPTSGGSTGRPKLIVSGSPSVVDGLLLVARCYEMLPGRPHLVTGPLYHNGPFSAAFGALFTGGTLVVMTRFDAASCLELIERHRVDHVYLVPTMMSRIWKLPAEERGRFDLSSLRIAYHLAAPCPQWLKEAWIEWLGPERVWELYGGTEQQVTTVISGAEWLAHRGSVGRPFLGMGSIRILDADGRDLPPGEVGEVFLRRPEGNPPPYRYVGASPRRTPDGWESLGDMGRLDEDGYLYLADRLEDMILVGGANVYPAEVEAALDAHPGVRSSCVIGLPDDDLGERIHAIVQADGDVSPEELRAWVAERLAPYKVPRGFELTDETLRDDAGKMRRSALRAERAGR
ncbi:MAG TPA: AMP-binding protein [Candidatus Eisenbacteria bacterium]|nr:AMP-binding protein [Candidatus Eisenbacteria bacterium]